MNPAGYVPRAMALAICLAVLLPTNPSLATKRRVTTPGIDKSGKAIRADLARMFPYSRHVREYHGSFMITSENAARIETIEARPEVYRMDGLKKIRLEPNPMFGKFLRYMFPHWAKADTWLALSLETTRHTMCPKIAHVGDAWVIVRGEFIEVLGYVRAEFTVTRLAPDEAFWKEAREIDCDGPPVIDEIR